MARLHTALPVLAFTPKEEVRNQLALTWGVRTFVTPEADTTDEAVEQVDQAILEIPGFESGDTVVIVAGAPQRVDPASGPRDHGRQSRPTSPPFRPTCSQPFSR